MAPANIATASHPVLLAAGGVPRYERHRPEETTLHTGVREQLESFLARACERDRPAPRFVEQDLRAYLQCGVLAHGFLRLHCDACGHDRLVAFSCKRRGLCPSCGAVTFIQRFGSALNLNVHFHALALDGVHVRDDGMAMRFLPLPPPRDAAVPLFLDLLYRWKQYGVRADIRTPRERHETA